MESNCTLPIELIYRVLFFLGPRDIVQLRTVSKQFNAIAYDPAIWRSLYTIAHLPRYPGPFPTQSTEFLERTLVHSEWLAKSWTTQPMRCVFRKEIPELGLSSPFPQIINGRWVIGCESSRLFVVCDIDSGSSRVLLWENDSGRAIYSWSAISAATDEGLIVYIVFNDVTLTSPWKLLEFCVDSDSGHLRHSLILDVPTRIPEEIVCLDGKRTPFLHIVTQQVIFDARTKRFCEFPEFHSLLFRAPVNWNFIRTLLTKTHLIRIRRVFDPAVSPPAPLTLIQAFTPPADSRSVGGGVGALHLSHEGIFHDSSESYRTIRDSITDHITGRTTIRLLRQSIKGNAMYFSCVELALPKQFHTDSVLPVTVDSHDVAQLDFGQFKHRQHITYIESSDDGHVRGFVRFSELNRRVQPVSADLAVKFTIDASGERCIATLGPAMTTQIDKPFPFAHICFDNVRGRLCFAKGGVVQRMHGPRDLDRAVVVMDIK